MLLFLWLRALPGGTVSAMLGERATPESRARLSKALGLDEPICVQYLTFAKRVLSGQFGASTGVLPGTDALQVFLARLPATIELSLFAILIAIIVAIPLGYIAARRHGGTLDSLSVVGSLVGVAVPVFFLAFLLKYCSPSSPVSRRLGPPVLRHRRDARHRLLRPRRAPHPRVRRCLGRLQAPDPARRWRWRRSPSR